MSCSEVEARKTCGGGGEVYWGSRELWLRGGWGWLREKWETQGSRAPGRMGEVGDGSSQADLG